MRKWKIDPKGLRRARKILGLEELISVKACNLKSNWGEYDAYPSHQIFLNTDIPFLKDVNHVFWHELGHARQCEIDFESDGVQFLRTWNNAHRLLLMMHPEPSFDDPAWDEWRRKYYAMPLEEDAEDIARKYDHIRLVRSA